MKYNLGLMDQYPIEAAGSCLENNPMFRVVFKQPIDPVRLEEAFYKAIEKYPLFGTCVKFDKRYYLETNTKLLKIIKAKEEERPKTFGENTNDYPWQVCYYNNKLTFEWLHGVSDGIGAFNFLKQALCFYYGIDLKIYDNKYLVAPGLEPFFDNKEKGINYQNDPEGFSFKEFPAKIRGYKTTAYSLKTETKQLLDLAKVTKSSIAPIISILFSQAIRSKLPNNIKNRKVACNVVVDLRRLLNYETMHNCVEYKRITYLDEYDDMSFSAVAKIYKQILDNARLIPNVVRIITDRVNLFRLYHIFRNEKLLKLCFKTFGKMLKHSDCNFVLTYLGKADFPLEVIEEIEDFDFKVWHDFGECILSCLDYNGTFNLNISDNFVADGIVDEFIELSKKVGIYWELIDKSEYEQAHFER